MKKSRVILFIFVLVYNLAIGICLRNFLCLSPTLQVFYLLSFLPTLFLLFEIKSKAMRSIIFILLALVFLMNFVYAVYCRRVFPFLAIISVAVVLIYFTVFADSSHRDNLLTKIFVLLVSASMIALLFTAYIFVYKQGDVYLINGQATLWDTETVELADEICADCYTDEEKVKAIHEWMIRNFEYDYGYTPIVQYSNVNQTVETRKGICYDFAHLFAALCRSQNISCYVVDGTPYDPSKDCHTWNRVYFNGSWWNMDVTHDIVQTEKQNELYGFYKLPSAYSNDEIYYITRIY